MPERKWLKWKTSKGHIENWNTENPKQNRAGDTSWGVLPHHAETEVPAWEEDRQAGRTGQDKDKGLLNTCKFYWQGGVEKGTLLWGLECKLAPLFKFVPFFLKKKQAYWKHFKGSELSSNKSTAQAWSTWSIFAWVESNKIAYALSFWQNNLPKDVSVIYKKICRRLSITALFVSKKIYSLYRIVVNREF